MIREALRRMIGRHATPDHARLVPVEFNGPEPAAPDTEPPHDARSRRGYRDDVFR